jgi:hypothetical protein
VKKQQTLSAVSRSGVANQGVLNPSLATPDSGVFNPESGEETADQEKKLAGLPLKKQHTKCAVSRSKRKN